MKQLNKKIIYLFFAYAPSEIVRGNVFENNFIEAGFYIRYFRVYSLIVQKLIILLERYAILQPLVFFFLKTQMVIRRIKIWYALNIVKKYNAVVVVKYCTPSILNSIKKKSTAKVLYDFDDAVWLDQFLGQKTFKQIVMSVDYISCDNEFLANYARQYNSKVFVLNGPPQVELFDEYRKNHPKSSGGKIKIGWLGSQSTLFYLYAILEPLEIIGKKFKNVELILIGTGDRPSMIPRFENLIVRNIPKYDQEKMIQLVSDIDIALYPLFDNMLSIGRGILKASIYMSAGIPVVASSIGDNIHLISTGQTGFLASTKDEWVDALSKLIFDSNLRKRMGDNARLLMKQKFSKDICFNQIFENFLSKLDHD